MKKTTFKDINLPVSVTLDRTYMDYLETNGITYSSRCLPIFQSLLPADIISYGGYEIAYTDSTGCQRYAYPFVTQKTTYTKCVTFLPDCKLDNLYLLDLEQALRTGKLIFETDEETSNAFQGFDFTKEIKIETLLDTVVELKEGSSYEFNAVSEFPKGITGKKIMADGDAVNVFLANISNSEPCLAINEQGGEWKLLKKEDILAIFG